MGPYTLNTASGALVDLKDPSREAIRLEDIAGALSRICRFGGQAREFYSVAQHAVLVRGLVVEAGHPRLTVLALHHDSHEAYVGDVPTPLKRLIGGLYEETAAKLDVAIAAALEIDWPKESAEEWTVVKQADMRALNIEAARLLPQPVNPDVDPAVLPALDDPLSPREAERAFMRAHKESVGLAT